MSVFWTAQRFDDFIGDTEVAMWRLFYVFCFPFSPDRIGVDQGPSLCCGVRGARRFQLTWNNKPELFEKDDGLIV